MRKILAKVKFVSNKAFLSNDRMQEAKTAEKEICTPRLLYVGDCKALLCPLCRSLLFNNVALQVRILFSDGIVMMNEMRFIK